jgi:hypothetical protein
MAEWAKRMGDAAGVDMGDDYDEMIEEIASGDEGGPLGSMDLGGDDFSDLSGDS